MRVLMVGDVIGRPGRRAVREVLPGLRRDQCVDLVIANGENAAGGRGLTLSTAEELFRAGVDVITSGNHIWDQKEIIPHLDGNLPILRPLNYPAGVPGKGHLWVDRGPQGKLLVVNLCGRVFMGELDCPFQVVHRLLATTSDKPAAIVVDFHGEVTSEKYAMGWHLDGRVGAVFCTHTHVATADARILPKGTAYVTDVGMVGPYDSVIGGKIEPILAHFRTQLPARFDVASGAVVFNAVLSDIDGSTGLATSIKRIDMMVNQA